MGLQAQDHLAVDRIHEALDNMVDAMKRFPPNATMPYYAACYCAQQGMVAEARAWLEKAFAYAESQEVRQKLKVRALDEPDLKSGWHDAGDAEQKRQDVLVDYLGASTGACGLVLALIAAPQVPAGAASRIE